MLFGLAGAHRTGKSTLAKAVAEDLGIEYVSSSFGEAAKRHGINAVGELSLTQRVDVQVKVLMDHQTWVMSNKNPVITDRTPIDMLAYMLAEFNMHSHKAVDPEVLKAVEVYKSLAMGLTQTFYDTVFVVGQLDTYAEEPGKPPFNRVFQDHIQLLIDGAACNLDGQVQMAWIETTDLEERKEAVHKTIVERLDLLDTMRNSSEHVH